MATLTEPRRTSRKQGFPWIPIGLVLLLAGAGLFWLRSRPVAPQNIQQTQTAPVVQQNITITVSAAGVIKPLTPVNISPKQPGRLAALYVDQGDRVRTGQLLARMDATNFEGQLMQAQGSVAEAEANLRKLLAGNRRQEVLQAEQNFRDAEAQLLSAGSTYQSSVALVASGAISRNQADIDQSLYESARARVGVAREQLDLLKVGSRPEDIDATRAQVLQAKGNLKTIQVQMADTVIRAPFAGIITQKFANPGAFVTPTTSASATTSATSSSIFALAGDLEAVVNVSESDIRNIYPGQSATLRVDAFPGQTFKGEVRLVAPEAVVTQNVTSFEVRARIGDVRKDRLKSGMNLTASFLVGQSKDALLVPTTAIVSEVGGTGVFVPGTQGKPDFRPIEAGATVGSQTQVIKGLVLGERVFITFPSQRKPNDRPVRNSSPLGSDQRRPTTNRPVR